MSDTIETSAEQVSDVRMALYLNNIAMAIRASDETFKPNTHTADIIEEAAKRLSARTSTAPVAVEVEASALLAIRDALRSGDLNEAWHELYKIADPKFCEMEPWRNLEHKAALAAPPVPVTATEAMVDAAFRAHVAARGLKLDPLGGYRQERAVMRAALTAALAASIPQGEGTNG